MTLSIQARVAARGFDVSLEVEAGETLAILGPNGAGKSTLLDIIAGLLKPDVGRGRWGDTILFEAAAGSRGRWVPPHRRGVSLLAQEPLLFPHLSVLDNVAFGPKSAGETTDAARATARGWLAEVEASDLAASRPARLSGGQAQRVAIARALASNPQLLLLDEPLAALDIAVAPTLRRMLRRVLATRTAILVTHEVLDALTLADRVVVMNNGTIVEHGPTADVLERPRHPFTAELSGLNLIVGTRTATGLVTAEGRAVRTQASDIAPGYEVAAAFRPAVITVRTEPPSGSADNVLRGIVSDLEPRGDLVRVRAGALRADLVPGAAARLDLAPGSVVFFAFDPAAVSIYPR